MSAQSPWIDIHTHLNFLEEAPEAHIQRAQSAGVERIITIGTEPEDHGVVLDLARKHYPVVSCTLGVHPHEAKKYNDDVEGFIREHAVEKEVVAVGEIGLDYYYDSSPRDQQRDVFEKQLQIAKELNLPFEIHTRDAEEDTVAILKNFRDEVSGLIHCFTGTQWLAKQALDLGFNISFSGIVTFKNAEELRDVVKYVPLDRMHVETDAPFLTPVPHRGQKNSPEFVIHTAERVAELKGIETAELSKITNQNALKMFSKLSWTPSPQVATQ